MNTPPDSWSGPVIAWVITISSWITGGASGIELLVFASTLVWTILKASNELTRRRILNRAAKGQCHPGAHPMRRATDLVQTTATTPGALSHDR